MWVVVPPAVDGSQELLTYTSYLETFFALFEAYEGDVCQFYLVGRLIYLS